MSKLGVSKLSNCYADEQQLNLKPFANEIIY